MTEVTRIGWSETDQQAIREQLDRILQSGPFQQSRRRQRFLEYIVGETLAGRGDQIKGYNIAVEVLGRSEGFNGGVDPIVRVEAARLRDRLREYYEADGRDDPIRIELPKGSYTPHIEFRQAPTRDPRPDRPEATAQDRRLGSIQGSIAQLDGRPTLAVLPFVNIGDDPQGARFADGITEDIITDLSHSKDLIVIARNSTEVYKGKPIDIRQIGRDLNVKYVLEGSIQSLGERICVTAQLIEAASGSHVWSERYDRPVDDLFAVQNDVTQRIAATLVGYEGAVAEAERSLLRRKSPANLSAFDTYLLAMEAKHRVTKESLIEAEGLFRKALQLDPQLARAYVGLVECPILFDRLRFGTLCRGGAVKDDGVGREGGEARSQRWQNALCSRPRLHISREMGASSCRV